MAYALDLDAEILSVPRAEERTDTVRIVEYSHFPHRGSNRGVRLGFTRDISRSGLCLGADHPERVGSMLRLEIRSLDGGPIDARVGRVAWTSGAVDGRHWIGVKLLTEAADPFARSPFESPDRGRRST